MAPRRPRVTTVRRCGAQHAIFQDRMTGVLVALAVLNFGGGMSTLTTKVLIEIRDEIKATRTELREEIRSTNVRLDVHEQLLVRIVDVCERHENAIGKLVVSVDSLTGRFDNVLGGVHKTAHDDDRRRVDDLDLRVTRLEGKKPGGRRAG